MTSSQTSRAATLTAAVSPLAAFSQTASSFVFAPAGSVLCAWICDLHVAMACAMFAGGTAVLVEVLWVVEEVLAAGVLLVVAGVLLWLLVVELVMDELEPQPAMSAALMHRPISHEDRRRIISGVPPGLKSTRWQPRWLLLSI